MNFKSLLTRSISGIVYVGLIIGCIFWGIIPFSCVALIFGVLAVWEFESICGQSETRSLPLTMLNMAGVACLSFGWLMLPLLFWLVVMIFRPVLELYAKKENPVKSLTIFYTTQLYIGLPMLLMTTIGDIVGLHFVLAIFLMIWINDTGAFIVGSSLGRHRLFERISPKKSWEGFCGGLVFNLLAGWLFAIGGGGFWNVEWNVITWLCMGLVVTVFATWGDLIESLVKRTLKIKDSGNIIPGHGGILDRIDSLLLVIPAVAVFLVIMYFIGLDYPGLDRWVN